MLDEEMSIHGLIKGNENSVNLTHPALMEKGRNKQILHNHPFGESFSLQDLTTLMRCDGAKGISLITNKGHIETLQKAVSYDKIKASKKFHESFQRLETIEGLQKSDVVKSIMLDLVKEGYLIWKM